MKIKPRLSLSLQSGQTIIEVLLAALIVGLVVTAAAIGLTYSVKNNAEVRYKELATAQAQEVIEAFRRERDKTNWSVFRSNIETALTNNAGYCFATIPDSLSKFTAVSNFSSCAPYEHSRTSFRRIAQVSLPSADTDTIQLTITVSWHEGAGNPRSITVNHWLKNWN